MFVPLICLSFLFQLCIYDAAPTPSLADYLNPTESITDGEFLVSAGNNFALGFFSPGNSSYRYVGIWYYKIPQTTVVWVANRDNPINDSSGVLSFDQDGNLVVSSRSNQRRPLWSTNVSLSSNSTFLRLLNSGNLVLYMKSDAASNTTSSRVLWESFDHPAHTWLPGMKLGLNWKTGLNRFLTSWKSKDDPSRGMFSFGFYSSFDSHRRSTEVFLYNGSAPVWRTGPWNGQKFSDASEMSQNNYLFNYEFVDNSDELYLMYSKNDSTIFTPFVIEYSGTVERLMWIERNSRWRTYNSKPKDNCDYYVHCGAYGICRIADNALECSCLPGFEPKSPMDWYLRDWSDGCVRKRNLGCSNGDGFLTLVGVKLPDTSMAALVDKSLSVKECEQGCSKNCSCTAYAPADKTGGGSGCIAWFGELMDMRYFNEVGDNLYLRVDAVELAAHARKRKGFLHVKRNVIILRVSLVVPALLLFAAFMHRLLKKRNGAAERSFEDLTGIIELQDDQTNPEIPFIELNVVAAITDNFSPSNLLGRGGFGAVYKGRLINGKEVAVKRLSKNSGQGMEEFKNEVLLISKLQHRNLVRLLASCVHEEEKILIYEYMPNNSLDSFIFDKTKSAVLDWKKRLTIIDGIARGVLYLHHDSRLRIIHRDLKASNVLLDDEMNPKISDFGMARIFGVNQVQANTMRVVGTYGYMSPEYAMHGIFSIKSDVFSFGVLLLEIITGKKNNIYFHEDPSTNLIEHVWELWKESCALDLVDSSMNGSYPIHEVSRCIQVGLLCVQESALDRPNMSTVIFMLGSETKLPTPKTWFYYEENTSGSRFIFRRHETLLYK